jgi:hypothetical protein
MKGRNRKVVIDELTQKLLGTEKSVAKIRFAMKTSVSVRHLRRLVTELRTVMGNRDALERQLARLHFPIPLFWPL